MNHSENIERVKRLPKYWGRQQLSLSLSSINSMRKNLDLIEKTISEGRTFDKDNDYMAEEILSDLKLGYESLTRHLQDGSEFVMYENALNRVH